MARLVKKTAHEPFVLGDKKICMCGLSESQPFCDKSHLKTNKEIDNKLYWYVDGSPEEIETTEASCCGNGECCGGEGGCCDHQAPMEEDVKDIVKE